MPASTIDLDRASAANQDWSTASSGDLSNFVLDRIGWVSYQSKKPEPGRPAIYLTVKTSPAGTSKPESDSLKYIDLSDCSMTSSIRKVVMSGFVDMAVPLVVGLFGFVVVLIIIKASSQSKNDDEPEE